MPMRYSQWKIASMYLSHKYPNGSHYPGLYAPEIEVHEDCAEVSYRYVMPTTPASECRLTYRVFGDGSIQTTLTYDPVKELGDMPEFGVMFKLDADYDHVTWYGMGPEETYVDRCAGAKLGVYKNKVEDNMAKYLVPQECGNKVGVRWATVTNRKGRGMMFSGDKMEFSALPYTPHELENAMHPYELPQVHYTVVRVAKQQMGVGGDGQITDENRLVAALPTIKKLISDGGKVILCSHLGKPKGEPKPELSLAPVAVRLSELLGQEVKFAADDNVVGDNAKAAVAAMKDGEVVLLQNTRYRAEETKNIIDKNTAYKWSDLSWYDKLYSYIDVLSFVSLILVFAVIGILIYINSKKKFIEQIQQKSDEAIKASRAKTDFLSRMSHEIRTPMNAILGMAAIGRSSTEIKKKDECIDQIIDSGNFLLQIINDILDMNKIEQNKIELKEEYVESMDFVGSIKKMLEANAKKYNVELRADFSKYRSFLIKIDPLRTKQIYVNIINNALKFSNSGSYVDWIMEVEDIDEKLVHIHCVIRDYGCGMSKEFQKKMFMPFEQEYNEFTNKVEGTGLGLTIVKNLVEIMGGTIECESEPMKGTTFTIDFDREVHSIDEAKRNSAVKPDESILKDKNVLLAEDNDINAAVAMEILKAHGMNVERAKDGQEVVDMYLKSAEGRYDAILMDVRMPKIDGMQATKIIRNSSHDRAKSIPIIAMTADAFDEDMKRTMQAGMNAHLTKPIDIKKLIKTLVSLIHKEN